MKYAFGIAVAGAAVLGLAYLVADAAGWLPEAGSPDDTAARLAEIDKENIDSMTRSYPEPSN